MPEIAIVMGSKSDLASLKGAFEIFKTFGLEWEARVLSAHRTPDAAEEFAKSAEKRGIKIIICAAGMAAHLGGVIAANTILPVIGIPMPSEPFNGMDALLAMVQMPPGIPVATVTAGKAGAKNAVLLAVEILALTNPELRGKLRDFRTAQTQKVLEADASLNDEIAKLF